MMVQIPGRAFNPLSPQDRRYDPARHLAAAGIPSSVWFEDAGVHYRVRTGLFHLHLVPSADKGEDPLEAGLYAAVAVFEQHATPAGIQRIAEQLAPQHRPVHLDLADGSCVPCLRFLAYHRRLLAEVAVGTRHADDLPPLSQELVRASAQVAHHTLIQVVEV
jgi:hypothetical protein